MLVLGDLGETFPLLFIGLTVLICPCAIALVASLLAKGTSSREQLRESQVYCFAFLWLISLGALIGTFIVGESHFGTIVAIIYVIAASVSISSSGLSLAISTERKH